MMDTQSPKPRPGGWTAPVFKVVIPARHASTRLPGKPLAGDRRQAHDPARLGARRGERCGGGHSRDGRRRHRRRLPRLWGRGRAHPQRPPLGLGPHQRGHRRARLGSRDHRGQSPGRRTLHAPGPDRTGRRRAGGASRGWGGDPGLPHRQTPIPCSTRMWSRWSWTPTGWPCISRAPPSPGTATPSTRGRAPLPRGVRFLRHIGLYAYRAGFLQRYIAWPPSPLEVAESLEQLRILWHGEGIHVDIAVTEPGPGVDTPEDLKRVAELIGRGC